MQPSSDPTTSTPEDDATATASETVTSSNLESSDGNSAGASAEPTAQPEASEEAAVATATVDGSGGSAVGAADAVSRPVNGPDLASPAQGAGSRHDEASEGRVVEAAAAEAAEPAIAKSALVEGADGSLEASGTRAGSDDRTGLATSAPVDTAPAEAAEASTAAAESRPSPPALTFDAHSSVGETATEAIASTSALNGLATTLESSEGRLEATEDGSASPAANDGSLAAPPSEPTEGLLTPGGTVLDADEIAAAIESTQASAGEATRSTIVKKFKPTSLSLNKKFLGQNAATTDAKGAKAATGSSPRLTALGTTPSASPATGPRLLTGKISSTSSVSPAGSVAGWAKPSSTPPPTAPNGVASRPGATDPAGKRTDGPPPKSGGPPVGLGRPMPWGRMGPGQAPGRGNLAHDFPTAQEVAMNKRLKAQSMAAAIAAREKAVQDRAAASAAYNAHLLETLDGFRGTHLDPNAHHWDEEDDDEDDLFGEVVEFGDGTQYKVAEVVDSIDEQKAALAALEAQETSGPVSKAERFTEDYDRTRGPPRGAAGEHPPFLRGRGEAKTLFNERLGRFEPYSGKQRPPSPPRAATKEPRKDVEIAQRQRDEPPHQIRRPPETQPEVAVRDRASAARLTSPRREPPRVAVDRRDERRQLPPHLTEPLPAAEPRPRRPSIREPREASVPRRTSLSQPAPPPTVSSSAQKPPPSTAAPPPAADPAKPPPAPQPPNLPTPDLETLTRSELTSAAERARKRRQEEEAAREAERERAKQKLLELEARLKSPPKSTAAVPAPAPAADGRPRAPSKSVAAPPGLGQKSEGAAAAATRPAPPSRDYDSWRKPAPVSTPSTDKLTEGPAKVTASPPQPRQILNRPAAAAEAPANAPGSGAARTAPSPGRTRKVSVTESQRPGRRTDESGRRQPSGAQAPPQPTDAAERPRLPSQDAPFQPSSNRATGPARATAAIGSERSWRRAVSAAAAGVPARAVDDRQLPPHLQSRDPDQRPAAGTAPEGKAPLSTQERNQGVENARPPLPAKKPSLRNHEPSSNFDEVMSRIRGAMSKDAEHPPEDHPPAPLPEAIRPTLLPRPKTLDPPAVVKLPAGNGVRGKTPRLAPIAPSPVSDRKAAQRKARHEPQSPSTPYLSASAQHPILPRGRGPPPPDPADLLTSKTQRPPSPRPVWNRYAVKIPASTRKFKAMGQALAALNATNPTRVSVLSWDPPLAGVSPRTLSRDDLLFRKKFVKGIIVSTVSLPQHRILRAKQPLNLPIEIGLRDGPVVLRGRGRVAPSTTVNLKSVRKARPTAPEPKEAKELELPYLFAETVSDRPPPVVEAPAPLSLDPLGSSFLGGGGFGKRGELPPFAVSRSRTPPPLVPSVDIRFGGEQTTPSRSSRMTDVGSLAEGRELLDSKGVSPVSENTHVRSHTGPSHLSTTAANLPSLSASPWKPSAPLGFSSLDPSAKDVWSRPDDRNLSSGVGSSAGAAHENSLANSLQDITDEFPASSLPRTLNDFKSDVEETPPPAKVQANREATRKEDESLRGAAPAFTSLSAAASEAMNGKPASDQAASSGARHGTSPGLEHSGSSYAPTGTSGDIGMSSAPQQGGYTGFGGAYPPSSGYQVPPGYQLVPIGSMPPSQAAPSGPPPSLYSNMYPSSGGGAVAGSQGQPSSPWTSAQANGYPGMGGSRHQHQQASMFSPGPPTGYNAHQHMSPTYSPMAMPPPGNAYSAYHHHHHPGSPSGMDPYGAAKGVPSASTGGAGPIAPRALPRSDGRGNGGEYGAGFGIGPPRMGMGRTAQGSHPYGLDSPGGAGYAGSFTPFHNMSPAGAGGAGPGSNHNYSPLHHPSFGSPYGSGPTVTQQGGTPGSGGGQGQVSGFFGPGGSHQASPIGAGRAPGVGPGMRGMAPTGPAGSRMMGMAGGQSPYQVVPSSAFAAGRDGARY